MTPAHRTAHLCPECDEPMTRRWVANRKFQDYCDTCEQSRGEPYTPETLPIKDTTLYFSAECGRWRYTLFDQYGHTAVCSRSYKDEEECREKATEDLDRHLGGTGFKICTVVIWPPSVEVKGRVIRKGRKK